MFKEEKSSLLSKRYLKRYGNKVIDLETSRALELGGLVDIVKGNAITGTGEAVVTHSIMNPLLNLEEIKDKQESLREIRADDKLRQGIIDFLSKVRSYEEDVHSFLDKRTFLCNQYDDLERTRDLVKSVPKWAKNIPKTETPYLEILVKSLEDLSSSKSFSLSKGGLYRRPFNGNLISSKGFKSFKLAEEFRPTSKLVDSVLGVGIGGFMAPAYLVAVGATSGEVGIVLSTLLGGASAIMGGFMGKMIGESRDEKYFIDPLRNIFSTEEKMLRSLISIGSIDELIAYNKFGKDLPHSSLPNVTNAQKHFFRAKNLINVLQHYNPNQGKFVPVENLDVGSNGRPAFYTSPNSAGKSSSSKAAEHAQILGQSTCYVPADEVEMAIADKVFYQVGINDGQGDREGGLGTSLSQTRDLFLNTTPRSLVVIDDLIEGTSYEEKTRQLKNQLAGFAKKGVNLIYVGHHPELAKYFREKGVGTYMQVEFKDGESTRQIIPGICENSRADLVARRVRFDKEDISKHLIQGGYMEKGEELTDFSGYAKH